MTDEELKKLKEELEQQERDFSYQRRILHGKIDILRAEIVARLQKSEGRSALDHLDVSRLTEILTGKMTPEGLDGESHGAAAAEPDEPAPSGPEEEPAG